MKNRFLKLSLVGSVLAMVAATLAGCDTCKPGKPGPAAKYKIEVSLDDSLKSLSVIVDLVGVNPSSMPRWDAYDMGKYWHEGDPMRRDADKKVLNFVSGSLTQTLEATNSIWDQWKNKGVTQVLVLADLPGAQTSRPGTQDARRQILPLDKCSWPNKTGTLKVLVQRSGIVVVTPVRSAK